MSGGPLGKKKKPNRNPHFFWSMKKSFLLVSKRLLIPMQRESVSPF